ncbi:MAG: STAS domain-containing protein [Balneolia bacterium]|nr:STAS domain-containing protein [Balneolia bacterium]
MKLDIQQTDHYAVITPGTPKLDSTVSPDFKSNLIVLGNALETGGLIMNLEHVEFADSSGLSSLLLAHRLYRDTERTLVLCELNPKIAKLLEISKLTSSFIIVDKLEDAIEYLSDIDAEFDEEDDDDEI